MSLLGKLRTALRLTARADWGTLRRQWRIGTAPRRLRRAGGRPFVHRDLGFASVCHPDWPDSAGQFLACDGDKWEFSLLARWLRPGDVVFDLGANLGLYSCAALAAVKSAGRVVAVDADPAVVRQLEIARDLLRAPALAPVHAAIAEQDGTLTFFVQNDRALTGAQSLRPTAAQRESSSAVTVPALSLRTLAGRYAPAGRAPSLVKIDIEGAEGGALAAVPGEWLGGDGPLWIVEINPSALAHFGTTPAAIVRHFPPAAFNCWLVAKHPLPGHAHAELRPLQSGEAFADSMYYNLLAVPRGERWRERRAGLAPTLPPR